MRCCEYRSLTLFYKHHCRQIVMLARSYGIITIDPIEFVMKRNYLPYTINIGFTKYLFTTNFKWRYPRFLNHLSKTCVEFAGMENPSRASFLILRNCESDFVNKSGHQPMFGRTQ